MKFLFVAVFVALAVYVSGEGCFSTQTCVDHHITSCSNGYHVECSNRHCECVNGGNNGGACTARDDCHCRDAHDAHCVDGRCHCIGRN